MRIPVLVLFLAWVVTAGCGCMVAIPQPGQTPQQVSACTTDATWHNVTQGAAGVLAGGAATEASVAATQDPNVGKTLAVSGAITAGVAGGLTLVSALLGNVYTSDGCKPSLSQ